MAEWLWVGPCTLRHSLSCKSWYAGALWALQSWGTLDSIRPVSERRECVSSLLKCTTWDQYEYRAHPHLVLRAGTTLSLHLHCCGQTWPLLIRSLHTAIGKKTYQGLLGLITVSALAEKCCWTQCQALPSLKYLLSPPCLFRTHPVSLGRHDFLLSTPGKHYLGS